MRTPSNFQLRKSTDRRITSFPDQSGVTLLVLLFSIVVIGLSVSMAARQWKTIVQRELEADLLARGVEIQRAIALYSETQKAGRVVQGEIYPPSLEILTKQPKPFLRKAYKDPVGRGEWEYLRGPDGGIKGVRSLSTEVPINQHNFPPDVQHFQGRSSYKEWVFEYPNPSTPRQGRAASGEEPAAGAGTAPDVSPPDDDDEEFEEEE